MKISVGICAYNEARNIGNILSNLLNQPLLSHQELSEIIVVCSGCTDGTDDIVKSFQEKDARIKLINQVSRQGKSKAQNIILKEAKGNVIVSLSADTYPAKGSIAILADAVRGKVGGVDSKVLLLNETQGLANFISHFIWRLHNRTIMYENKRSELAHLGGDMFAIKRGVINQIPPHVINDDAYMGIMISSQGYQLQYVPQAIYYGFGPRTIRDYLGQRRRVLFGHQQLKRLLGKSPMVLKTMTFCRPWDAVRIFLGEVKQSRLQDLVKVFAVIVLEVIASLLALWDGYQKRVERHILWDRANSTKTLVRKEDAME